MEARALTLTLTLVWSVEYREHPNVQDTAVSALQYSIYTRAAAVTRLNTATLL